MNTIFIESFWGMFNALGQIFFIAIIAVFLVRKNIFPEEYIKGLSFFSVNILLPALVFSNTLQIFNPETQSSWWILPIAGFSMSGLAVLLSSLFFIKTFKINKDVLPVAAFQNAGYLILPIGKIIYKDNFEEFTLYVFLFMIGFNILLWSVGKHLLGFSEKKQKLKFKSLITAPLVANISSVLIVLLGLRPYIPDFVIEPVGFIGKATVPVAIFILGATLGTISIKQLPQWHVIMRVIFIKLFLISSITFVILYNSGLRNINPLMCDLILLEATAAPAANLILMVHNFGGNKQKIGSLMLFGYTFSLITMPIWVALWQSV